MIEALSVGDVSKIGVGVILALVVVGIVLSLIITAIIGRIVVVVVVVVLAVLVWQQRTSIRDKVSTNECKLSATFFGIHLDAPADVKRYCRTHLKG